MSVQATQRRIVSDEDARAWEAKLAAQAEGDPEVLYQLRLEQFQAEAQVGWDDLDAGRYVTLYGPDELREHLASLRRQAHEQVMGRNSRLA